jgi:hypothetical protein
MSARNEIAQFITAVKDVHVTRMEGLLADGGVETKTVNVRVKAAFPSQVGSSSIFFLPDRIQITRVVSRLDDKVGSIDLKRAFLGGGLPRLSVETAQFSAPSLRLSKYMEIPGISEEYRAVIGTGHAQLSAKLRPLRQDRPTFQKLYNALVGEYRDLPRVKDYRQVEVIVWLCLQQMSPADIDFWIYGRRDRTYQEFNEHVKRLIGGYDFGFVPSPSTLRAIEDVMTPRYRNSWLSPADHTIEG